MKIKVHGSELSRMMKTISQCVDSKVQGNNSNIEICHADNMLSIRSTNGVYAAEMKTPLLGGDGEKFCVDGAMFAKVVSMCNKETEISADGQHCTVKCSGRTKLSIVKAKIPEAADVTGTTAKISSDAFARCLNGVSYAVSADMTHVQLTGVLVEIENGTARMVALDGFQMSVESVPCEGDAMKIIVPGTFMKLVAQAAAGEEITLRTDGGRVQAMTDTMTLSCGLIPGEYIDYRKLLPADFKTTCLVNVEDIKNALKSGAIINSKQNLIRLEVSENTVRVTNNSEEAEYEAEIPCDTQGDRLQIAFNSKYLLNTFNAIDTDDAVMNFTTAVSPCIIRGKDEDGTRLLLPVRVQR